MPGTIHRITEKKSEEKRLARIEERIKELGKSVKSCNSQVVRQAYILGVESTSMKDATRIGRLIAKFELDCECLKKHI